MTSFLSCLGVPERIKAGFKRSFSTKPLVLAVGKHFCQYYQCSFTAGRCQGCSDPYTGGASKNGNRKFQVTEVKGGKLSWYLNNSVLNMKLTFFMLHYLDNTIHALVKYLVIYN